MGELPEIDFLALIGLDPGETGHIGDAIFGTGNMLIIGELSVEHAEQPFRLAPIAIDRIGYFLRGIELEMAMLAEHRPQPAHLPHQPLANFRTADRIKGQEQPGFLRQID